MGGITGATSGKFVVMAATLLFHGRVDNTPTTIAIVPGAPSSALSAALAKRLKQGALVKIGIRAAYLRAAVASVEPDPGQGAEIRIGRDILDANPIEIDFPHHRLRLLLPGDAKRTERGMIAIPVTHRPDGTMTIPLTLDGDAATAATLDLTSPSGAITPVVDAHKAAIDAVALKMLDIIKGTEPSVGLGAFTSMRVIFDLGHDRIWVAR